MAEQAASTRQLEEDFWAFSVQRWKHEVVRDACLHLQDAFGLSVNEILYAWFAARRGCALLWVSGSTSWTLYQNLILPLRAARVAAGLQGASGAALYQRLKQVELEAERLHQRQLCEDLPIAVSDAGFSAEVMRANMQGLLAARLQPAARAQAAVALQSLFACAAG